VSKIEFSAEQKAALCQQLKSYVAEELDHEIGQFARLKAADLLF